MRNINIYTATDFKGVKATDAIVAYLIEMKTEKGPATLYNIKKLDNVTSIQAHLNLLIDALSHITEQCHIDIYTDNAFIESAFNHGWLLRWVESDFITAQRKPVKHREEWEKLYNQISYHEVKVHLTCHHEYSTWLLEKIKKEREQSMEETA